MVLESDEENKTYTEQQEVVPLSPIPLTATTVGTTSHPWNSAPAAAHPSYSKETNTIYNLSIHCKVISIIKITNNNSFSSLYMSNLLAVVALPYRHNLGKRL